MNVKLTAPGRMVGEVDLPASKSISNRALIISALGSPHGSVSRIAECDDTHAVQQALASGADSIDVGAAGTAMRFLTAYFAVQRGRAVTLDGTQRMRQRPIGVLVGALRSLGASIEWLGREGYPPLRVTGAALRGPELHIDGSVSSQYISALLMIAPMLPGGLDLRIDGVLTSRPYVEMTLSLMRQWGAEARMQGSRIVVGEGGYKPQSVAVEADWSAASYWYALQSLLPESRISLKGLQRPSVQGDSRIADIAWALGVDSCACGVCTDLHTSCRHTSRVDEDLSATPDIAQTLAVWLCLLGVPYRLTGLHTLRIKETDRVSALRCELLKLGYAVETGDDFMAWDGHAAAVTASPRIATYHDHRMAMAFAPAAVKFPGLVIEDAGVVSKSYPQFWQHLAQCGFAVRQE